MDGKFFEKRATSADGRFLRDMPGRVSGDFYKAAGPVLVQSVKVATVDGAHTGFHRPAIDQPEALEAGGQRFHAESEGTDSVLPGIVAPSITTGAIKAGRYLGKQASDMRFLGTSFQKTSTEYRMPTADEAYDSLKRGAGSAADFGKGIGTNVVNTVGGLAEDISRVGGKGLDDLSKNKLGALLLAGLGARIGLGSGAAVARGVWKGGRALLGRRPPAPPESVPLLVQLKRSLFG